jgi:hypothetical protein
VLTLYRLLLPADIWNRLSVHLHAAAPNEDGAFLLVRIGRGATGVRLVVHDVILPFAGAWEARGRDQLRPSGQWLSAVIGAAIETNSGIAFVHSHPDTAHPPTLSPLDQRTSVEWSRSLTPTLDRPFLSLVWTPAGLCGLVFEPGTDLPQDVDQVEVIGESASRWVHPMPTSAVEDTLDDRQVRALGTLGNARLRQLTVALVGVGGTGSPLAELLARIGVRTLTLIDPDVLDTESNLRRVVGSSRADLLDQRLKVDVVARHVQALDLGVSVRTVPQDVRTQQATRDLLDADVAIVSTDTHGSRSFVNQIAFQYYLPVIDVGTRVGVSNIGSITGMPVDVRVLLPDTGCLWCRGVLDAGMIRAENLPTHERDQEVRDGYVQGFAAPQPSLAALNTFAASLATLTMLRLMSPDQVGALSFIADGWERYFADQPEVITGTCVCQGWRALADEAALSFRPPEMRIR